MSRIGKKPIPIPQGVKVQLDGLTVRAEGPKGKLSQLVPTGLTRQGDRRHPRHRARQRGPPDRARSTAWPARWWPTW